MLRPLAQQQSHATGRGVHEQDVAAFDAMGPAQQIFGREPFEHDGGSDLVINGLRQRHDMIRFHGPERGIAAKRQAGIGDAVARQKVRDARAYLHHLARGLGAGRCRQRQQRILAGADVDIEIVHADGRLPQAHLSGARRRHTNDFGEQHFRATILVEDDRLGLDGIGTRPDGSACRGCAARASGATAVEELL
jgi:hypothetical protein